MKKPLGEARANARKSADTRAPTVTLAKYQRVRRDFDLRTSRLSPGRSTKANLAAIKRHQARHGPGGRFWYDASYEAGSSSWRDAPIAQWLFIVLVLGVSSP